MRKIKFLVDFATKLQGEEWECDSLLASTLVNDDQVAVYIDIEPEEGSEDKPKKKKA